MKNPQYELNAGSDRSRGKDILHFSSADGINSKNSFRDSEKAIAENVKIDDSASLLIAQTGFGYLPVIYGNREEGTLAVETSDRAYQLTKKNLKRNNAENTEASKVAFYTEIDQKFDRAIYAPQSYEPVGVVKNRLSALVQNLEIGGKLFIAGRKTVGIQRYQSHLKSMEGNLKLRDQQDGQKVYCYTKRGKTETSEKTVIETGFTTEIKGQELDFKARKGLFSPEELDDGSRLLIENLELDEDDEVLDLACGYGIIGIFIHKLYGVDISLSDDNATATYYAKENLEANNVEDYVLKNRDCLDGFDKKFDKIVSNPPTHQGSGVTNELFEESYKALRSGGSLYIVYNQNMNYREKISGMFGETEVLAEKDNYRVLKAVK